MAEYLPTEKQVSKLWSGEGKSPKLVFVILCFLLLLTFIFSYLTLSRLNTKARIVANLMGTEVEIVVNGKAAKRAAERAVDTITGVSRLLDWRNPKSEVSLINSMAGITAVAVSKPTFDVIYKSVKLSKTVHGVFDITIGPLADLWREAIDRGVPPSSTEITERKKLVNWEKVELDLQAETVKLLDRGMKIDLGGVGKGYAVGAARNTLVSLGIKSALINSGSSIVVIGVREDGKPWRIGVRDPRDPKKILGVIILEPGQALSTSGDYEKYFEWEGKRYHHIIDPRTGYPAETCQAVTVVAGDAAVADILSTAVFILGPKIGMRLIEGLDGVSGLIVTKNGEVIKSSNLRFEKS